MGTPIKAPYTDIEYDEVRAGSDPFAALGEIELWQQFQCRVKLFIIKDKTKK